MTRTESIKIRISFKIIAFLVILPLLQCNTSKKAILSKRKCLENALDFVIEKDPNLILHKKNELLLIANFGDIKDSISLHSAILPKSINPVFLMDVKDNPQGYYIYNEIMVIIYSKSYPKYLDIEPIKKEMDFMIPFVEKEPEIGNPPFPPIIVEPLVFSFKKSDTCYFLVRKTVADILLK